MDEQGKHATKTVLLPLCGNLESSCWSIKVVLLYNSVYGHIVATGEDGQGSQRVGMIII